MISRPSSASVAPDTMERRAEILSETVQPLRQPDHRADAAGDAAFGHGHRDPTLRDVVAALADKSFARTPSRNARMGDAKSLTRPWQAVRQRARCRAASQPRSRRARG